MQSYSQALLTADGDTPTIIANARNIAQTTATLVQIARREAAGMTDKAQAGELIRVAQLLATATSNSARAAKASAQKQDGARRGRASLASTHTALAR